MSNAPRFVRRIFLMCYTILCLHGAIIARYTGHPRLSYLLFAVTGLLGLVWLATFVLKRPRP